MKKIIFTLAFIAFCFKIFAISIYAPTLVSPTDSAKNQMPNVLLDWSAVPGAFSYKVQLDTSSSFTNPSVYTATLSATNASKLLFGTKYYWRLKAIGAGDSSAWSSVRSFTVIPAVILKLPGDGATDQLKKDTLQWYSITGITNYDYQIDTILNFNSTFLKSGTVGSSVTSINLSNILFYGTKYYWKVRARHNADTSLWSSVWSFTTISSMPSSPNLISPVDLAVNQMPNSLLSWAPVLGATSYMFELDTNYSFSNPNITSVANTSKNAQELLFGNKYYWRVKAIDSISNDSSNWSLTKSFTVIDTVGLISPINNAIDQSLNVPLKWDTITGITKYDYQIDTTINFNSTVLISNSVNGSITNISLGTLLNFGTKYYWRVRARHNVDTTLWSPAWTFTTLDTMPSFPNLILPADLAINQMPNVLFSWIPVSGATSYRVELDTNILFSHSDTLASVGTSSSANAQKLLFGRKYYWRVKAINSTDSSAWSLIRSFTVIDTVDLISPVNNAIGQLLNVPLKWDTVTGITKYDYQIDTTINFNSTYLVFDSVNASATTVSLNTIIDFGTKYYWRVRARHSADSSLWSPAWSFTTLDTMPNFPNLILPADLAINQMPNVLFSWTPVSGATSYMVELDTNILFSQSDTLASVGASSYVNAQKLLFGEKYYWRVKAINSTDSSAWSLIRGFTVIDTVGLILPVDNAINQMPNVLLKWTSMPCATSYMIELDTNSLFSHSDTLASVGTSKNAQELLFGEKYYWRVKTINSTDSSNWSLTRSFTVIDTLNQTYPNDGVTNQTLGSILKWDAISGVTYYNCEIDTTTNFNSSAHRIISVNSNLPEAQAFTIQSLFGTKYYWRVRALNTNDTSAWSKVRSFTTVDKPTLALPYNGANGLMPDAILRCNSLSGTTNYQFEIDTIISFNSPEYTLLSADDSLPFVQVSNNELLFGTKYYWRVRSTYSGNYSNWSSIWNFTTIDTVTLISPANGIHLSIATETFKWKKITGITGYGLEIDTTSAFTHPVKYLPLNTALQQQVNNFTNDTYYWRLCAYTSRDTSAWSTTRSFTITGVGIESLTLNPTKFSIFPNPVSDNAYLSFTLPKTCDVKVKVYGLSGKLVMVIDIANMSKGIHTYSFDCSAIQKGTYLIQLISGTETTTTKFIKM